MQGDQQVLEIGLVVTLLQDLDDMVFGKKSGTSSQHRKDDFISF
jgi:hypothetical protein